MIQDRLPTFQFQGLILAFFRVGKVIALETRKFWRLEILEVFQQIWRSNLFGAVRGILNVWDKNQQSLKPWWSYTIHINYHEWYLSQWTLEKKLNTILDVYLLYYYVLITTTRHTPKHPLKGSGFAYQFRWTTHTPLKETTVSALRLVSSVASKVSSPMSSKTFQNKIEIQEMPGKHPPQNLTAKAPENGPS